MKRNTTVVGFTAAIAAALVVAGCGSGSSSDNTVIVNGDVPLAYAKRAVTLNMNPTDGTPSAPGGDLIIREKSSASAREINVTAAITQGNGDVSDPEVSYDGKKIVFAMRCPTSNTATIEGRAGLHRPLEHLGIRHHQRRPGRRQPAPHHGLGQRRRCRSGLPAGRPRLRVLVEPPDLEQERGRWRDHVCRRRVRARARAQPAHDGCARRRNHADLRQPEPRPQPGGAPEWRHHVLALGTRRPAQPLRDLPRQARRHRHVRAVRRAQPGQQLPAPARHGPEGRLRRPGGVVADAAVAHPRGRRADDDRRGQLLRAEHAGQRRRAAGGRPVADDRQGAERRPRPVAVRPRDHALPAVGRHRPRAGVVPPLRSHARRRRDPLRQR